MKVLSISTDRKMFEDSSSVLERSKLVALRVEELHIIVFTLKKDNFAQKFVGNLHIYPTNSSSKLSYVRDAKRIGKEILSKNGLKQGDFVVTCQDPFETSLVGVKLKKIFKIPLQIQVHTDFLSPHFQNSFLNKIRVWISRFTLPKADGVRVVGQIISQRLLQFHIKSEILPVFIDVEKIINETPKIDIRAMFPQFKKIVLMVSRLSKEKRIDTALSVIKNLVKTYSDTGLIIVGDGEEKSSLENLVNSLNLQKNVLFVGWQKDVVSYYKGADVFFFTSEYEGYGLVLNEARASGSPIVTTKVGLAYEFPNSRYLKVCEVEDKKALEIGLKEILSLSAPRAVIAKEVEGEMKKTYLSKDEYFDKYVSLLSKLN